MTEKERAALFEAAGLLNLIVQGITVPNLKQQAEDALNKIGEVLAADHEAEADD